jgi:inositol-phosphate phosphatase/L-galactose 1-phosphate phosphatase/histidinol-phosphatase
VLESFAGFAMQLADEAGRRVLRHFRKDVLIEHKPDQSPVTAADRDVEAALREMIERQFPEHGIVGEEFGSCRTEADYVWVIDPIDGTKAFVCGIPMFGTLIALTHDGHPILGVIDQAFIGERWLGMVERPTTYNGAEVKTRPCCELARATACSSAPRNFTGADAAPFERLYNAVALVRYGTDCYGYGLLANGCVDLVLAAGLDAYDYLALAPIVAGAGGCISDWEGRPLHLYSGATRVVACGDATLHSKVIETLSGGSREG